MTSPLNGKTIIVIGGSSGIGAEVAKQAVARWIEVVYNRRRLHTSLGMVPPVEFEENLRAQAQNDEGVLTQAA